MHNQPTERRIRAVRRKNAAPARAPQKLKLLFVIVNREKAELYTDFLAGFEINLQLSMAARGTADIETLHYLGLAESPKAVLIGVVREDRAAAALEFLEEKFRTVRNGKGIAYTVPMTGIIGASVYRFLCNNRKYTEGRTNE